MTSLKNWARKLSVLHALTCFFVLAIPFVPSASCDSQNTGLNPGSKWANVSYFSNPILNEVSADPMVIQLGDFYYMVISKDSEHALTILKSGILTDFRNATRKVIYQTPDNFQDLWAPEMHLIDGSLYIYFAMSSPGRGHRTYVLKSERPADLMEVDAWAPYAVRMLPGVEENAIDATILKYPDGRLYWIWCRDGTLLIAPLNNPEEVGYPRPILRSPKPDEGGTNEGAFIVYRGNRIFLIFSAWRNGYCLMMMGMDDWQGKDPLDASSWWEGPPDCVFQSNWEENVVDTGHASFTFSPDGSETWMVYHGRPADSGGWDKGRFARAQKIEWTEDNFPIFPRPSADGQALAVPSGQ